MATPEQNQAMPPELSAYLAGLPDGDRFIWERRPPQTIAALAVAREMDRDIHTADSPYPDLATKALIAAAMEVPGVYESFLQRLALVESPRPDGAVNG